MTRLLKLFGKIVGVLLILYIVLMILLLVFVKTKDLTPIITKLFYEKTGQVLRIDGNLSLSVFPWPIVGASNITIENPKQFNAPPSVKYFVKIGKVSVRLKLLDLFQGKIYPTNISLDQADLNLVTLRSGKTNWGSFIKSKPENTKKSTSHNKTESTATTSEIFNFSRFPVIQIKNSNIHFINLKMNSRTDVTDLFLNSPSSRNIYQKQVDFSAQIKHDDPKIILGLKLTTEINFDPKKTLTTLKQIEFSAKWLQVQHLLPQPIVLTMRGKASFHTDDFQTSLRGNFKKQEGNILLTANRKQGRIGANLQLKSIHVSPLAEILTGKDWIEGILNASIHLTTEGATFESWMRNLSGNGSLKISRGKIKGLDMNFMLINTINQLLSQNRQKPSATDDTKTTFDSISADYQINRGELTSNNFLLDSKAIRATGKGRINLPNATIDATLLTIYKKNPNWKVPLKITGSLFKPNIQPDTGAIVGEFLKKDAQKGLGKTLDNISKQLKGLFD